jgi:hypothetical protein
MMQLTSPQRNKVCVDQLGARVDVEQVSAGKIHDRNRCEAVLAISLTVCFFVALFSYAVHVGSRS